jgi:hypothetical protein
MSRGSSSSGRTSVSKADAGGSIPSLPASSRPSLAVVTVRDNEFSRPEMVRLAIELGLDRPADAVGRHAQLVAWCLSRRSPSAPLEMVETIMGKGGVSALVDSGLGHVVTGEVDRLVVAAAQTGLERHLKAIAHQRKAGRGRAAGAQRGERGRYVSARAEGSSPE